MIVAQISDLHVKPAGRLAYGVVDTAAYLERAVARLAALAPRPDLVLATGDLTDGGRPEEYARLRALLAPLPMPVYLVMGNHDLRDALREAFPDHAYLRADPVFVHYVVEGPLRIVVADSTMPGEPGGTLDAERLAWIDAALGADRSRPAMLVLHHPPFATGIVGMDADTFRGSAELETVVRRHPHLERIACGHLHRPIVTRWGGTLAMTAPSTAHQLTLDLQADAPVTFVLEPAAFALHVWDGAALTTHVVQVDDAAGPFPFRNGGKLIE
jgi:Icc protein